MIAALPLLGWILAAFLLGLWWGERGRRLAAERWAKLPRAGAAEDDGVARKIARPPSTAERLTRLPVITPPALESHATRLAKWIRQRVKQKGLSLPDEVVQREAERLTNTALGRE